MNKKLSIAFLVVLFISIFTQSIFADGCGIFYIYKTEDPFCSVEHCGIWDNTAVVQKQYYKRKCVRKDNYTYWEEKTERKHLDCNC